LALQIPVVPTVHLESNQSGVELFPPLFLNPEWFKPQGEKNASIFR